MKKTISKLILLMSGVALLMTSCLGDGDNSATVQNDFAYITTSEGGLGVQYARTSGGILLTSKEVREDLNMGDCVLISYKVSLSNLGQSNIYNADYTIIEEAFPYAKQNRTLIEAVETGELENLNNGIKDMNTSWPYALKQMGDRIWIRYAANLIKGESSNLEFYYDADKQVDASGKKLDADKKVLDIRMKVTGTPEESEKPKVVTNNIALNLSNLRGLFEADANTINNQITILFRYYKLASDNKTAPLQISQSEARILYEAKSQE